MLRVTYVMRLLQTDGAIMLLNKQELSVDKKLESSSFLSVLSQFKQAWLFY